MMHSRRHSIGWRAWPWFLFVQLVGFAGCDDRAAATAPGSDAESVRVTDSPPLAPPVIVVVDVGTAPSGQGSEPEDTSIEPREVAETLEQGTRMRRKLLGDFELTYYWMAHEDDRRGRGRRNTRIYDSRCRPIARVQEGFAMRLSREGTGKLKDGRVVNVAGPCECEYSPCFFVLKEEERRFGVGVLERPLSPFRSVAVDPSMVSIGTKLYIPELDGLTMPGKPPWGGFVHDGCVVADDRGGAVEGKQIDFFMAKKPYYQAFHRRHRLTKITVYRGAERCHGARADAVSVDRNSI